MIVSLLSSITTFFATIGPVEAAVLFATLTPQMARGERRRIAAEATAIATAILAVFTLLGGPLLHQLGVSLAALQTAGGIILLVIALDMVFARPDSVFKLTPLEGAEAKAKSDIAIFPLATPLLAGPGAMSSAILMTANANGEPMGVVLVLVALAVVMAITLGLFVVSHELNLVLGVTAQRVLMRVFGILVAAIAVQSVFNGVGAALGPLRVG